MLRPPPLLALLALLPPPATTATQDPHDPDARAAAVVAQMRPEERTILTLGVVVLPFADPAPIPPGAVIGSCFVPGIHRLVHPSPTRRSSDLQPRRPRAC